MKLSEKLSNAIRDEEEAIQFYLDIEEELSSLHVTGIYEQQVYRNRLLRIITSIRKDEGKHKKYLEDIYKTLTG